MEAASAVSMRSPLWSPLGSSLPRPQVSAQCMSSSKLSAPSISTLASTERINSVSSSILSCSSKLPGGH